MVNNTLIKKLEALQTPLIGKKLSAEGQHRNKAVYDAIEVIQQHYASGVSNEIPYNKNPNQTLRDWPDDFQHENGNYHNRCTVCSNMFMGYKHRVLCRWCAVAPEKEQGEISDKQQGYFIPCDCMSSIAENTFCEMMSIIKRGGSVDVIARVDGKEYRWQCDGLKYAKLLSATPAAMTECRIEDIDRIIEQYEKPRNIPDIMLYTTSGIPTSEMLIAGARSIGNTMNIPNHTERAKDCWNAMLKASATGKLGEVPKSGDKP